MIIAASTPIWVPILTAVISAFTIIGATYLKYYLDKKKPKREHAIKEYIKITDKIYKIISDTSKDLNASRILIFKTENGGGIPRLGSQLYSSIMFESNDPPLKSIKEDWQRRLIDQEYINVLSATLNGDVVRITTADLPESQLKYIYEAAGIKNAAVFNLFSDDKCYVCCSIAYTKPFMNSDSPEKKALIDSLKHKLKSLLEQSNELMKEIE